MGAFSVKIQIPEQGFAEFSPEAKLGPQADTLVDLAIRVFTDRFVQETVKNLTNKARDFAPKRTGNLKKSIKSKKGTDGWTMVAGAPYASFVEYGCFTRKSTKILTSRGIIKLADVNVGDLVLTHKNRWKKVLKKHEYDMPKEIPIYKIKLNNEKELSITHNHPLYVLREDKQVWVEAQNLLITDKILGLKYRSRCK